MIGRRRGWSSLKGKAGDGDISGLLMRVGGGGFDLIKPPRRTESGLLWVFVTGCWRPKADFCKVAEQASN